MLLHVVPGEHEAGVRAPFSICKRRFSLVNCGLNFVRSISEKFAAKVSVELPSPSSNGHVATRSIPEVSTVCWFDRNRTEVKLVASVTPAASSEEMSPGVRLNRLVKAIRSSISIW